MPLTVCEGEPPTSGRTYVVFYSSRDETGKMWCPDCRDVEDIIRETFDGSSKTGLIIYVGQKPEWKSQSNKHRTSYNIGSIPTVVRFNNGREEARLVETEILQPGKLEQLIQE